ncbi:MAG: hypothetical protein AAB655_02530 [Patescibacteria group bacterium]
MKKKKPTIVLRPTKKIYRYLEMLAGTGFYGRNVKEATERVLSEAVFQKVTSETWKAIFGNKSPRTKKR